MSLKERLINVARAELKNAARKVRASAEELLGGAERSGPAYEERIEEEARVRDEERRRPKRKAKVGDEERIQRYYANLELPLGAPIGEVKAAYRRLMRRYHPDLHQEDPEKAKVATKLAQELRAAYEALLVHLGSG